MKNMQYTKDIPIRHEVDVLIVGGGPAGCAAAWAANRGGAKVLLLEGHTCLGGLGTAGMVPAYMALGDGEHMLCAGYATQLLGRLYPDLDLESGRLGSGSLSIVAEDLKHAYEQIMLEEGIDFVLQSQLIDVRAQDGEVKEAVFAAKSGLFAVSAKQFIDCTGDGDLSVMAGAPFEKGDEEGNMMAGTLCSLWAGIDWMRVEKNDSRQLEQAIADGVFAVPDRSLPGMWKISDRVGGGNIGHTFGVDGTDERSLTRALIRGREYVREYRRYYQQYLSGFENMELITTGSLLGIRESRRITCLTTLTLDAFQTLAVFPDEIGRYCYSVDIHPSNNSIAEHEKTLSGFKARHLGRGESYGIPYGCLIPKGLDNVLVAGRCIGADRYMQGSTRVMPGCYITGQAAGTAAALCVQKTEAPNVLMATDVQKALKKLGAYLPNA